MASSRAVLTIVHDESVFLPIWLRYYGQYFDAQDMYVLDHDTTDGSTDVGGFVRERVSHSRVDHAWLRDTIQAKQHELQEHYDVVLITDVDEIVAPNPKKKGTLGDYIDALDVDFVNCRGYEVLHKREDEAALDLTRPILQQRGWWFKNFIYSKPLLGRVPLRWVEGFHHLEGGRSNQDLDLALIHLHRMDYERCRERHRTRQRLQWDERDLAARQGYQNRITADEEFERWFYEDSCNPQLALRGEKIPAAWRDVV